MNQQQMAMIKLHCNKNRSDSVVEVSAWTQDLIQKLIIIDSIQQFVAASHTLKKQKQKKSIQRSNLSLSQTHLRLTLVKLNTF